MQDKCQVNSLAFKRGFENIYNVWHFSQVCCVFFRNWLVNNKPNVSLCSWYAGSTSRAQSEQLLHQKVLCILYNFYINNHRNVSVSVVFAVLRS